MAEMLGQYLIVFREVLEASLITSIVLAYLARTGRRSLIRYILYGLSAATALSLLVGVTIWLFYGALSESAQVLFEGTAALIAVAVLSSMIYWMAQRRATLKAQVEQQIEAMATRGATIGLTSFLFVAVFREGLETVLFLTPFTMTDLPGTIGGILLGTASSLATAYAIFAAGMRINIRRFFYLTSILLILLAGGLSGYGVHELIEYSELSGVDLGWLGQPAYVLNIPSDSPFHHKGIIGSVFAVIFGYTVQAEWLRLIVHFAYLIVALPLVVRVYRRGAEYARLQGSPTIVPKAHQSTGVVVDLGRNVVSTGSLFRQSVGRCDSSVQGMLPLLVSSLWFADPPCKVRTSS